MHRYLHFQITPNEENLTVESILRQKLKLSSGLSRRLKRVDGAVTKNGEKCFSNERVKSGDTICVNILACEDDLTKIEPKCGDLDIVYEDEDLLILSKPAGLLVHSAPGKRDDISLANLIAYHLGGAYPFHAVNRLDKSTSGLMAVAKSGYIHKRLSESLHTGDFVRTYLAICVGAVDDFGVIDAPIARCEDSVIARKVSPNGAPSVTRYETVSRTDKYSLVKLCPETGRTHQLRLHMSHIGHPLVGDFLYGKECDEIRRAALHSAHLSLTHPVTGEKLTFDAPLPDDMAKLISNFYNV